MYCDKKKTVLSLFTQLIETQNETQNERRSSYNVSRRELTKTTEYQRHFGQYFFEPSEIIASIRKHYKIYEKRILKKQEKISLPSGKNQKMWENH